MRDRSAQRLLIFLPPRLGAAGRAQFASGTVVPYVALSARESTRGEAPVALLPKAGAVDLVFDSSDVFITAIESPKLSEGRLRMALPNILEDRLLADATDCHFAFNVPRGGTGTTTIAAQPKMPVAVIDRGILTRALDVVTDAGFKVRAAYSEIYTVPAPAAGVLSVRVDRGRGIARSATHDGFAFELTDDAVPPALALAVRQLGIKRIQVFGRDGPRMAPLAQAAECPDRRQCTGSRSGQHRDRGQSAARRVRPRRHDRRFRRQLKAVAIEPSGAGTTDVDCRGAQRSRSSA